jgi:hypothetical protein
MVLAQLRAIAHDVASRNGDSSPSDGVVFSVSRIRAMDATHGGSVDSDQPVFVVRLHGKFTAYDARVPPGQDFPHGHVMIIVVDATTRQVTDWSVGDVEPNDSALGVSEALG